ncbi:MAG: efflux RND transporter periplasmic adaptor subunit [Deltaproteobacteria bacterium]|nr:efflux RND transporter periplasmic adaptor subunit [Deltaproteobacteria bacterium]
MQRARTGHEQARHRAGLAGLALLVALGGCHAKGGDGDTVAAPKPSADGGATSPAEVALPVAVTAAVRQMLPQTLELSGSLAADQTSEVAAPAPGIVGEVLIDVGSRVQKGDVLVRIDKRDATMRLSQASAATQQAYARLGLRPGDAFAAGKVPEVQAAREALQLAETEAKRAKALVEGGSAPQAQLDAAKTRLEQARAQVDAAVNGANQAWAGLHAAKAAQDLSEKAASDTEVRAPFDGVITERRVNPGEYAQAGRVVAVLVCDRPLRLKFDVPEQYAARVRPGAEVLVTVTAYPEERFAGAVKRIAGALRPAARTLPVEAELPNSDGRLKPGFFATLLLLVGGEPQPAVLVPKAAIGSSGSAERVFVIDGGRAVEHVVAVGRTWNGLVEVRGAVKAGELVAVSAIDQLSDGAKVAVKK